MSSVRIQFGNRHGLRTSAEVFVDGQKLDRVMSLKVIAHPNDVVRVVLELAPDVLHIGSEQGAEFQAEVVRIESKEPARPAMPPSRDVREPQNAPIDWLKSLIQRFGGKA
jgi:hypothetical protein